MTKAAELAKMGEVLTNSQIGGRRNIIINGAMQVAQRATSATVGATNNDYATVDRFKIVSVGTAGRATMSQSTDSPSGFASSLKLDCSTADTSIAASEQFALATCIEGQDLQQIKKGKSDAEKITLSFYVKGNANATYNVEVADFDNTRHNTQTFSVTTSWNRIVMTFDADTSGALDNDNATSLQINWYLHAGSDYTSGTFTENTWQSRVSANRVKSSNTSFFDSTDRTFFITGIQLEVGSQATPFEHRSFAEELALCQRYCVQIINTESDSGHIILAGMSRGSTNKNFTLPLPVTMRNTTPSITLTGDVRLLNPEAHDYVNATDTLTCGGITPTLVYSGNMLVLLYTGSVTGVTDTGNADYNFQIVAASDHLFIIDSEL
jgi:hypothetical protein